MPRRSVRQRRRSQGCLSALISITAVVALLLVAAIFITEKMDLSRFKKVDKSEVTVENTAVPVKNPDEADRQMVLNANTFSKNDTAEVVVNTPIPTATPAPTATPKLFSLTSSVSSLSSSKEAMIGFSAAIMLHVLLGTELPPMPGLEIIRPASPRLNT